MTSANQANDHAIRPQEEVVRRALALMVVAGKAVAGADVGRILMERFGAFPFLSQTEREFMENPDPDNGALAYFSWRYECLHVLLWPLGVIEDLGRPKDICDVAFIDKTMVDLEALGLRERAKLRSAAEILAAQEVIYNSHWGIRDAQIFGKPTPDGLNPDVVYERHYAFNWLAGDEDWDEVSTDT
jgi:hypothetical protein